MEILGFIFVYLIIGFLDVVMINRYLLKEKLTEEYKNKLSECNVFFLFVWPICGPIFLIYMFTDFVTEKAYKLIVVLAKYKENH